MSPSITSQPVDIRRATDDADFRQAAALLHDYAHWIETATGLDPFIEQPSFAAEVHDLAHIYSGGDAVLLVAHDRGVPVATVAIAIVGRRAELKRLYVRPSARGRGLAGMMIQRAITAAGAAGCRSIWLESLAGAMDPAIRLYRGAGFVDAVRAPTIGVDGVVVLERDLG